MPSSDGANSVAGPPLTVTDLQIAFPGVGEILAIPHFALPGGSVVAVEGPSGSGKTSLLHALAGLERPARGEVRWGEVAPWSMTSAARDRWRRRSLGLVFQDIHLVEGFSALDNVTFPALFEAVRVDAALRERAAELLQELGIEAPERAITVMSRGERQRVGLARALLRQPSLLLADEPTASLDRRAAADVAERLIVAAKQSGATLLVTSHDPVLLERVGQRFRVDELGLVAA